MGTAGALHPSRTGPAGGRPPHHVSGNRSRDRLEARALRVLRAQALGRPGGQRLPPSLLGMDEGPAREPFLRRRRRVQPLDAGAPVHGRDPRPSAGARCAHLRLGQLLPPAAAPNVGLGLSRLGSRQPGGGAARRLPLRGPRGRVDQCRVEVVSLERQPVHPARGSHGGGTQGHRPPADPPTAGHRRPPHPGRERAEENRRRPPADQSQGGNRQPERRPPPARGDGRATRDLIHRGEGARHRRLRSRGRGLRVQTAHLQVLTGELLRAWADQPAIDHHCHPLRRWPYQLSAEELRAAFTEALDPQLAQHHVVHTAGYQAAIRRIANQLQCEATEAALLAYRNADDAAGYARRLLASTATGTMLVDAGFATAGTFTLVEQQQATGITQREIIRLETLAESLIQGADDPRGWFSAVRGALRAGIERGAVGVKTICAYRATLWLQPVDTVALGVAFSVIRFRAERGALQRLSGSALCHALLFETAQECRELDVPLQVHCGFGDPDGDLAETSPLGLRTLFIDPAYRGLRIALLHCYPYHREAAYLCSVFPDVYMDLSLTIPFAGLEGGRAMREALGLCPTSKLLYASDASRYPEVVFVAATSHREALAAALGELVDHRILDIAVAADAGRQVLAENARRVYNIKD